MDEASLMTHEGHAAPSLGASHHIILDGVGLLIAGLVSRSDITSAIPRISVAAAQRRHTDFSERDTFGTSSWHHGKGELVLDDPDSFFDSEDVVTWIPNQLTLRPAISTADADIDGTIVDVQEFAGNYYFLVNGTAAAGNDLLVWDNTNTQFDTLTLTGTDIDVSSGTMGNMVVYTDAGSATNYLYIAQGELDNAIRADSAGAGTGIGQPARLFAVFDNFLWRADNINELYYSEDPSLGAGATWTGPVRVGNASYPIRGMFAGYRGALWVGKDDGLYAVQVNADGTAYVATQIIDLSHNKSSYNGRAMLEYGNHLYVSIHNTLLRYDGSTIQYMGPDRGAHPTERLFSVQTEFGQPIQPTDVLPSTYQTGVTGGITGLAHDNNFLYASVDNEDETNSYIYLWGGTGWHTVYKTADATTRIHSVFLTSRSTTTGVLQRPVLWFSEDEGVYYMPLPKLSHNPLDDVGLSYVSEGHVITSWFDGGLNDVYKNFFDVVIEANNLIDHVGGNTGTSKSPATTADDAGVGTIVWADTGNIVSDNGSFATAAEGTSHYLEATNFSNGIPTGATVRGIKAEISRLQTTTTENDTGSPSTTDTETYGGLEWSSTSNMAASDNAYATNTTTTAGITDYLIANGLGLAVPAAATIVGCTVAIERKRSGGTAAIGKRETSSVNNLSANSQAITINKPTGTIAGDLMIASITSTKYGSGAPASAIEAPTGWTLINTEVNPWNSLNVAWVYSKRAGVSEPTSYTWLFQQTGFGPGGEPDTTSSNRVAQGNITSYYGSAGSVTATIENEGDHTDTIQHTNMATGAVQTMRIFIAVTNEPGTFTVPTSYSSQINNPVSSTTGSNTLLVAHRSVTSAAGTGTITATFTPSNPVSYGWLVFGLVLTSNGGSQDEIIQLVGNPETEGIGNNKSAGATWATVEGTTTFGSSSDTWGYTLTPTVVNSDTFGVRIAAYINSAETISIDQIVITVYYTNADVVDSVVRLLKGGVLVGDNKASASTWPGVETVATYGASNDLWGTTWTPAEVNAADFGIALSVVVTEGSAQVDHISITVYYTFEGNSISVEFQVDNYNEWYSVGDTVQGPISTHYLPNNDELEPGIVARRIRFRLTLNRNVSSTTTTPILVSWGTRFVVRPEARYGWNMTVKAYDNMYDLARRQTNGEDEKDDLREFMYSIRNKYTPVHLEESTMPPTLTNLLLNPSFEIDTDDDGLPDNTNVWSAATVSRTAQFKTNGVLSTKVVVDNSTVDGISWINLSVTEGDMVAAAVDIYVASGDSVSLRIYDSSDEVLAEDEIESSPPSRFVRASVFFEAPATDTYTMAVLRTTPTQATTFYVDAAEFITDDPSTLMRENKEYIDGDQLRCRWNGDPHNSTSTRQHGYFVYVTGMTESQRFIEDRKNDITMNSEFNLQIREAL
jgi:hypothetical protein